MWGIFFVVLQNLKRYTKIMRSSLASGLDPKLVHPQDFMNSYTLLKINRSIHEIKVICVLRSFQSQRLYYLDSGSKFSVTNQKVMDNSCLSCWVTKQNTFFTSPSLPLLCALNTSETFMIRYQISMPVGC